MAKNDSKTQYQRIDSTSDVDAESYWDCVADVELNRKLSWMTKARLDRIEKNRQRYLAQYTVRQDLIDAEIYHAHRTNKHANKSSK